MHLMTLFVRSGGFISPRPSASLVIHSCFRLRFATGEADFSQRNDNEVVNPGQKYWKWKTVEDYAKERKGSFGF